jgi:hypothetical protein
MSSVQKTKQQAMYISNVCSIAYFRINFIATTAPTETAAAPIVANLFFDRCFFGFGIGALPKPCMGLSFMVISCRDGNSVGSGFPSTLAFSTSWYKNAAWLSYRSLIVVFSKSIPCLAKKSRHAWFPPFFIFSI